MYRVFIYVWVYIITCVIFINILNINIDIHNIQSLYFIY